MKKSLFRVSCLVILAFITITCGASAAGETQGWYTIHCNVDGASVYFDSEYQGKTVAGVLSVAVFTTGTPYSKFTIEKYGYYPATQSLPPVVAGKTTDINVILNQKPEQTSSAGTGSIYVSSSPNGASVYLNNIYQGRTPLNIPDLREGTYTVETEISGYDPSSKTVTVYEGCSKDIHFSLTSPGTITVVSDPTGAFVSMDGVIKGKTPLTITGVTPRKHTFTLTMNGYYNWKETVDVTDGVPHNIDAVLRPINPDHEIEVSSQPAGADIYLDGIYVGVTMVDIPYSITDIDKGYHTVTLRLPGYNDYVRTVNIGDNEKITISADMGSASYSGRTGNAAISSSPAGAEIYIDGAALHAITPFTATGLSPGTHSVTLKMNGYQEATSTVAVISDETVTFSLPLAPETGPSPSPAKESPGMLWITALGALIVAGSICILKKK